MIMITVSFGTTACPLLFKTEESAKAVWDKLTPLAPMALHGDGVTAESMEMLRQFQWTTKIDKIEYLNIPISVQDDFGRMLITNTDKLCGAIFEDLEISKEGQIEQALHQARTQAMAQQRGQADPKLSALSRMQGPAMIHPFGPGNGRM